MRIEWATICKGIEDTEQGFNLLGVQQDAGLVSGDFPQRVEPRIAVLLATPRHEMGGDTIHSIRCDIYGPNDDLIATGTERFRVAPPDLGHYAQAEGRSVWPIETRFIAAAEGIYRLEVSVNDGAPTALLYQIQQVPELQEPQG